MQTSARVVLIGASNLTLGLRTVLEQARAALGGPLEVVGAFGCGRSLGLPSSVLGRRLPPILGCGLWQVLGSRPDAPTYALVTDVGNDIGYGIAPETLVGWVEEALNRLVAIGAVTVLGLLPLASLERVTALRFYMARTLLFPSCRLRRRDVLDRAREVNSRLREVAGRLRIPVIDPPAAWYGLDPIHIRRRFRPEAWGSIVATWGGEASSGGAVGARSEEVRWRPRSRFRLVSPDESWLFGVHRRRRQPSESLADGTTLAFY